MIGKKTKRFNTTSIQAVEDNSKSILSFVISGFRRGVKEILYLLECYVVQVGSQISTFRDNIPVPSSRANQSKNFLNCLTLEDGTYCAETSVTNYQCTLRNIPDYEDMLPSTFRSFKSSIINGFLNNLSSAKLCVCVCVCMYVFIASNYSTCIFDRGHPVVQ